MTELQTRLIDLRARFDDALRDARDAAAIDRVRVAYLGRSGDVTLLRRGIGQLPAPERPGAGQTINEAVAAMEAALADALATVESQAFGEQLRSRIDVTFPPPPAQIGSIHPIRRVTEDLSAYFRRHGFAIVLGPEIEPEYYNFDALNIPADHPAREGFDSFWLTNTLLLRPHTSPMQIRTMQEHRPPIAIVAPGKCFRRDALDARHLFQFHQVEGLLVARGIHFGYLKGMLTGMCREIFGASQSVRFRPSYFPF